MGAARRWIPAGAASLVALQIGSDGQEVLVAFGVFHAGREVSGRRDVWAEINAVCQSLAFKLVVLLKAGVFAAPSNAVLVKCSI